MNQTNLVAVRLVIASGVLWLAGPGQAVGINNAFVAQPFLETTLPGTTSVARPELAGVVLEDILQPFSFAGGGITGSVQSRVTRETVAGTLDFYWKVSVDPTSTAGNVDALRVGDFGF